MMLDMILEILKGAGADAWEVTETTKYGWEFYMIRHRLDQNRVIRTRHLEVRVFRTSEDGTLIGSASEEIPQAVTREEAEERIRELLSRASYIRNPFYTLNRPYDEYDGASVTEEADVEQIAKEYLETMRSLPETEVTDLNSCEIFVNSTTVRFLNSEGIDVTSTGPETMLEAVINARKEGQEIELYRLYQAGGCDREGILMELGQAMTFGTDRLLAAPMPKLMTSPVLFTTREAAEICSFFTSRMSAAYKARGYSDFEIGEPLFGGSMKTKISVEALRTLPNSSKNRPFDAEGARRRDTVMIRDGVPEEFLGDRQFSCALGLADSFIPGNYRISGGTSSEEELRAGEYLEAVEFSDFQVDALSGNLAGEIRLAYWHHDGTVTPVTGGSISGSMLSLVSDMAMSRELRQYDYMEIPAMIRLEGVSVTGIADLTGQKN